jgi:hypothetical protein
MPDKRLHRGPHPEDARLFAPDRWPALQRAVTDLAWLLSNDYALNSSLKLVGDRYQLTDRQRLAVMRATCSDAAMDQRRAAEVGPAEAAGQTLQLDGYNVLTTIEAALGGGMVMRCRDGCLRDLASMHGHYKRVHETQPALQIIGSTLQAMAVSQAEFLLDAPVSNSGRLKIMMLQLAARHRWPWSVTLVPDPDPILARSPMLIATADSIILDSRGATGSGPARHWINLTEMIISRHVPGAVIVPLNVRAP